MTKSEILNLIQQAGLSSFADELEQLILPAIRIKTNPTKSGEVELGISKFGGTPDLSPEVDWPSWKGQPMSFIAQLKMADIASYDEDGVLPHSGILYFFYDSQKRAWGFDPAHQGAWNVYFFRGDLSLLQPTPFPINLPELSRFAACTLDYSLEYTLPPWDSLYIEKLDMTEEQRFESYQSLETRIWEIRGKDGPIHQLLGHPQQIQGDIQLQCQLVSHGLYCGDETGYSDPRAAALRENAKAWCLLLEVDSDENCQMMWVDNGMIYYWIECESLQNNEFDKTCLVLQSY